MATRIQVRRDLSSNWNILNIALSEGEIGFETDTNKFKIGNGTDTWDDLPYFSEAQDLSAYLTAASASATYLTQASASTTYLTQASASTTYLTQSSASTTYLTQASASTTYLTQSSASNTYQTKSIDVITEKTKAYTLASGDEGDLIQLSGSSSYTVSIPTDATFNFPIGTQINLLSTGTGIITIAAATPETTTVNATPGLKLRTQWSSATLIKRAANTWVAIGDLAE